MTLEEARRHIYQRLQALDAAHEAKPMPIEAATEWNHLVADLNTLGEAAMVLRRYP
jgi:hypothetical protein